MIRNIYLGIYYSFARFFPTQPVPGWKFGYTLRYRLLKRILKDKCGKGVIVKQNAYFGKGLGLKVGDNSQLGENARIGPCVTLGNDIVMGPEVVIMTTAHAWEDPDILIRKQGDLPIKPVIIHDDVWLGTRVIILPGVEIGKGSVIGAGSIVTKDVPEYAVMAGVPAKLVKWRKCSNISENK